MGRLIIPDTDDWGSVEQRRTARVDQNLKLMHDKCVKHRAQPYMQVSKDPEVGSGQLGNRMTLANRRVDERCTVSSTTNSVVGFSTLPVTFSAGLIRHGTRLEVKNDSVVPGSCTRKHVFSCRRLVSMSTMFSSW